MKQSKLKTLILLIMISGILSGCSLFRRKVYVGPGQIAEIAEATYIHVWITNKATGKIERRTLRARPGWYVGRPGERIK